MELIGDIFQNNYLKICLASIMSLILAFAGDIKIIGEKKITYLTLAIFALMLISMRNEDLGMILLLASLVIISYNKQQLISSPQ